MPSHRPSYCRACGKHEQEVGRISWRGLCATDSDARLLQAHVEMRAHSGPIFERWRHNMAACVGNPFLDDARDEA